MAADEIIIETVSAEVIEVGVPGPQGPAGAAGAGLTTLTTAGDLLYRNNTEATRLPVGSNGQVLKVSGGLPAWGNESGAVTAVNNKTGNVNITASDVGAVSTTVFTTTGDLITRGADGTISRIPIGTDSQILRVLGSVPAWRNAPVEVNNYRIANTTINGSSTGHNGAPGSNVTSYTVPAVDSAVVTVAQTIASNLTINLNTTSPINGSVVRVDVVQKYSNLLPTAKVIVSTGGFGNFDAYDGHSMYFVYSTGISPNRWVRLVEPYNRTPPANKNDIGVPGEFAADTRYIYFCVGVSQWRRVAIANW